MSDAARRRLVDVTYVGVDDLDDALRSVEAIQAVAQADQDVLVEACALTHAAWSHLLRGEFDRAGFCLDRAEDAFAEVPCTGVWEWPLVHACRGALDAWSGAEAEAAADFDRAGDIATLVDAPAGAIVSTALRSEIQPGDTRPATELHVDVAWSVTWGRRGLAAAALMAGDLDEAATIIGALLAEHDLGDAPMNAIERGRTLVLAGDVQLRRGDAAAIDTLRQAADTLERAGARFPATHALLLLADAAPATAADVLRRARTLTHDTPAFMQLWRLRPMLHVEVLGVKRLRLGDQELALSRNSDQLVHLLAFAGPQGAHWETVADQIWPHVLDAGKAASNVTSLTRNTRTKLGAEAWRLRREGSMLYFDLDHASLDLADALATAEWCLSADQPIDADRLARAIVLLRRPVLPMWADSPWVHHVDEWRADRLEALTGLLLAAREVGGADATRSRS